jgi:Reverse transcriptase (RNA-dependent DNA polymerase)
MDKQCRSLFQKGCADATLLVILAIQTQNKHNQDAYILFVDLGKAYDSVNRDLLWKILTKYEIPTK